MYNIGGKDKGHMIDQEETEGIGNDFISWVLITWLEKKNGINDIFILSSFI